MESRYSSELITKFRVLQKTYQRVGRELEIWCHGFIDLVFFKIIDRNAKAVYAPAP